MTKPADDGNNMMNHDADNLRIYMNAELWSRSWSKVKISLYKQNSDWRN
jgi:hypothetical protein